MEARNMQERMAQSALMFGVCYMVCITVLYLSIGGFMTGFLVLPIALSHLKKSTFIIIACIAAWLIFAKDAMTKVRRSIEYVEGISLKKHKIIACLVGLMAATYLSLLKVQQHLVFQTT